MEIAREVEELASAALRTLGVAYRTLGRDALTGELGEDVEQALVWLGVVGMIDPPRPEAQASVAEARRAGVRPIMITGDHPVTAAAIAAELGISEKGAAAVTGSQLQRMDDAQLREAVRATSVFARVAPEHKLRIVRALHANGEIVAMTGDGVNDAPALKAADIGVAMGITGTDVAKGAADMILTDDNFASIVAAVEEGRSIFANIQRFLRYLLSSNIGEVLVMFLGVVLAGTIGLVPEEGSAVVVPLLATQILWINLLTDSGPALALGVEPADHGVMLRPPRDPRRRVIGGRMWADIVLIGLVMAAGTLAVMDWALPGGLVTGRGGEGGTCAMPRRWRSRRWCSTSCSTRSTLGSRTAAPSTSSSRTAGCGWRCWPRWRCRSPSSTCRSCSARSTPPRSRRVTGSSASPWRAPCCGSWS